MRLTREKIVRLSHQITEVLVASEEVEFVDDRDTIRQQVVQILTATLKEEEKIELEVRKRITSEQEDLSAGFQGEGLDGDGGGLRLAEDRGVDGGVFLGEAEMQAFGGLAGGAFPGMSAVDGFAVLVESCAEGLEAC